LFHITDPANRHLLGENAPGLASDETALAFDIMVTPNHLGHIVGPGEYELDVLIAADNVRPLKKTILISLRGPWYPDETTMLRDDVGISLRP
jgi:hypothetical protein